MAVLSVFDAVQKFYLGVLGIPVLCGVDSAHRVCVQQDVELLAGLESDSSEFLGIGVLPAVLCEAYHSSCAMKGSMFACRCMPMCR